MVEAIQRGLSLRDFEVMTIGMIISYIAEYNEKSVNTTDDDIREATQADFIRFR